MILSELHESAKAITHARVVASPDLGIRLDVWIDEVCDVGMRVVKQFNEMAVRHHLLFIKLNKTHVRLWESKFASARAQTFGF
jgi:hypothetical protein